MLAAIFQIAILGGENTESISPKCCDSGKILDLPQFNALG
jgi:hypothetical protein